MDMKFVRPLAVAFAVALTAELALAGLFEHQKHQQHVEAIRVASPGQAWSNAANVVVSTPLVANVTDFTSLVVPESGRYFITVG